MFPFNRHKQAQWSDADAISLILAPQWLCPLQMWLRLPQNFCIVKDLQVYTNNQVSLFSVILTRFNETGTKTLTLKPTSGTCIKYMYSVNIVVV